MTKKFVSVIIPTYKRVESLKRAIDSVLNQTYKNMEIIVIDDNDPQSIYRKKVEKLLLNYRNVKYIKHSKNQNGAAARNTGIRNATGEYISFLDDDDEFLPKKIEEQVCFLDDLSSSKDIFGCYTGYYKIKNNKVVFKSGNLKQGKLSFDILKLDVNFGSSSSLMIKKKFLDKTSGFNEKLNRHQDYDLLLKLFKHGDIAFLNQRLLKVYTDDDENRPSGDELINIKKTFFKEFESYLNKYKKKEIVEIKKAHYYQVAKVYLLDGELFKFLNYIGESEIYIYFLKNFIKEIWTKKIIKIK